VSRGRFYLRVESDEADFIRQLDTPVAFAAAVVSDRYLAAYPKDHPRYGKPRDELAQALDVQSIPWSVDPDTARLEHPHSVQRQRPRAGVRPVAQLELPLTAERLASPELQAALVERAAVHQLTARHSRLPTSKRRATMTLGRASIHRSSAARATSPATEP